jgi:hypothetical protein
MKKEETIEQLADELQALGGRIHHALKARYDAGQKQSSFIAFLQRELDAENKSTLCYRTGGDLSLVDAVRGILVDDPALLELFALAVKQAAEATLAKQAKTPGTDGDED